MRHDAKVRMRVYGGDHQAQKYACQDTGRLFPPIARWEWEGAHLLVVRQAVATPGIM
jgi:hypothetical protein